MTDERRCRGCGHTHLDTFVDLGETPLANSLVDPSAAAEAEPRYPLHARVCGRCLFVQLDALATPEAIFSEYSYLSSFSSSWVEHARRFVEWSTEEYDLGTDSFVVEVASNDGYLLRHFKRLGVPILGVEPAANVAALANTEGIPTEVAFFGEETAARLIDKERRADLVVGNNVTAHVPDLHDFVGGLATMVAPTGVVSLEFPHLLHLIERLEFDTIYHEHFSYLSLHSLEPVLASHGLRVFEVHELPTHGGSLRLLIAPAESTRREHPSVTAVREQERVAGLDRIDTYSRFQSQVDLARVAVRRFLDDARDAGRRIVGYGAAAKGNTLLNSVGAAPVDLAFVADISPYKQGRLLPGSHIPVVAPAEIDVARPDQILVLAWNLIDEISAQLKHVRSWGCDFVVPLPAPQVVK